MTLFARMVGRSLMLVMGGAFTSGIGFAQEASARYISPAQSTQKRGSAPGMKVKLISSEQGLKQYAVIFAEGDEAYSGLVDFAEKYHVTSGHFTAIVHTHMVVARRDGSASGGHVIEAIVSPTLEVFVTVDPIPLQKKYDPATDLTVIDPDSHATLRNPVT
jgi:uncharacterized protein